MGGKTYADYDRHHLARAVAPRWHQRINNDDVAPAIQEKFARNIREMTPSLYQFEHTDEHEIRPAIRKDLIREITASKDPDGIVPKRELAERVSKRGEGIGHDPDIIAEVYAEIVPIIFHETEITLTDTDGNNQTLTMVHYREMALPDDLTQIRTQFATQIRALDEDKYDLPDVVDVADALDVGLGVAEIV